MLMKCCPTCKGDGFYLMKPEQMDRLMNIAYAKVRLTDGQKWAAMDWVSVMRATSGPALLDIPAISHYEYDCARCNKTGELNWTRGKSVTPVC